MANGLAGRSTIVTGAAHGIGRAIARRFVKAGASVMMADIDEDRLEAEAEAIDSEGYEGRAQSFHGDLREKLAMTNLMAATIDAFDSIHVLVNAARTLVSSDPLNAEADRFEDTIQQNLISNLRLSQIVARRMIEEAEEERLDPTDRAIVNLSSIFARRTVPELLSFSVSCAGVEQLTRTLAVALSEHKIRVNAVAVGGVMGRSLGEALADVEDLPEAISEVVPLGRLGEPAEAAEAVLFLAAPTARFITGQVLTVDGGTELLDPLEGAVL